MQQLSLLKLILEIARMLLDTFYPRCPPCICSACELAGAVFIDTLAVHLQAACGNLLRSGATLGTST